MNADNNKVIYLHVGVPKTASSTIQLGLLRNQDNLAKDGYLYPKAGLLGSNHKNLFFEISPLKQFKEKYKPEVGGWEAIRQEIVSSQFEKVIITAEHFALLRQREINHIRDILPGQVKIIIYLRRQDLSIMSGWIQNAKRLVTNKPFLDVVKEEQSILSRSVYHYPHVLKKWEDAFGIENMLVQVFERKKLGDHIFIHFLKTCGITNVEQYEIPPSANVSPDYKTMGIILEIMKQIDFEKVDANKRFEIGKLAEFYCQKYGLAADQKYNAVDNEIYSQLSSHFKSGNRKVARRYLNEDTLFDEEFVPNEHPDFSIDEIPSQEILKLFAYILNNI